MIKAWKIIQSWLLTVTALAVMLVTLPSAPSLATEVDPFPRPAGLEADIAFWRNIFGSVTSEQALLHDNRHLGVVYETVSIPPNASSRTRGKVADRARGRYRKILNKLAKGKRTGLGAEEQRVLELWPADVTNSELRAAAKRIRFQQGLSDRYLAGLKRSGAWQPYIKEHLAEAGVPSGLAALPHVESSFNPEAHSHVGASGLWQFTRSTGRRFMEIDHVVDERRDPYRSSESAAKLLAYNYSILKSWPLAITAYNHGVGGMRRAVRKTGGEDFTAINREYSGRTFGFASRNFYLAFLAALEVQQNAEQYFGPVTRDKPRDDIIIKTTAYISAESWAEALGVGIKTLKFYNPALLSPVWDGTKHVPRGYSLRIPATLVDLNSDEILELIPAQEQFSSQTPDMYHKVRHGESLSVIAVRYDTSVTRLMDINNLRSRHRIRAGQTLRLPYAGAGMPILAGAETYTVRKGDSLSKIASRSSLTEAQLIQLNSLSNKDRIYAGQVLYLRQVPRKPVVVVSPPAPAPVQVVQIEAAKEPLSEEPVPPVAEPAQLDETIVPVQASLADSNDYSVASDKTIEVQAAETLGHYADWLGVRTQRLRDINELSFKKPVVVGRRVKLDFSKVSAEEFSYRRIAHHRDMQEAFFMKYRVVDTTEHKLKRGESVWVLTHREYNVPVWLVRQYNPDLDFGQVQPGTRIIFPRVEQVDQKARNRRSVADAS
ncbi:MAG: LysM peptidoglycan-binding domain-containing protein [Gammaproteobacteria bacterium]|nr:LysM peptidoglycan-binding domain-containing protein [Gammaproteobacteria bacterium]MCP4091607.1 LysM peptidoglycan-binding domain-containing protein [Gammaproteobacteria bacterium]MCP4276103.1 LysM peptidoglycan-binding domain-containing protein [Gammaproteobacteria bacterium]MCP4830847.1 LysM peptidoglycan-binding domain-containing protein [Gammaproteobacteria bacterium]MCP4929673.1 LysM peptidoglycan-binding domain-containing protein [Gammaproteobacteria bacterium]